MTVIAETVEVVEGIFLNDWIFVTKNKNPRPLQITSFQQNFYSHHRITARNSVQVQEITLKENCIVKIETSNVPSCFFDKNNLLSRIKIYTSLKISNTRLLFFDEEKIAFIQNISKGKFVYGLKNTPTFNFPVDTFEIAQNRIIELIISTFPLDLLKD